MAEARAEARACVAEAGAGVAGMHPGSGRRQHIAHMAAMASHVLPHTRPSPHLHESFAPLRLHCDVLPLIKGQEYFAAVVAMNNCQYNVEPIPTQSTVAVQHQQVHVNS